MVPIARCAWSAQNAEESFGVSDEGKLRDVQPAFAEQPALPQKNLATRGHPEFSPKTVS